MAAFSHSVAIAREPVEVFPWLLEEDRVPRWTGGLESYRLSGEGPVREGSRVRQVVEVSGRRIDVELEVTRHAPPHAAESRFSTNGIDVVSTYRLEPDAGGTRLTQSLEAKPTSFSGRLLLPVVQPHLERKVTEDLGRLRELLASG